jgi:ABC transporter DrrB family efflux protein
MTQARVAGTGPAQVAGVRDEPPGLARLVRDSGLIAGRYLRVLRGSPARLIYPILQPVLILALFVSVMENLAPSVAGSTYRQFLIPGIMIQNVVLTAPVTGLAIVRDSGTGLADRFRSLPMARGAVLIGRSLSDTVVFFAQALVMIGMGYLLGFHVRTGVAGIAGIVAVAIAFGTALGITCGWLALLIGDVETAERALFFPFIPLAFVSSAYAPVNRLAGWLQPIARVNPVSSAVGVVRALADGGPLATPVIHLAAWTAALALVPGVLAVRRWQSSP